MRKKEDSWIQGMDLDKGRVREYAKREMGPSAFRDGDTGKPLKFSALGKLKRIARKHGNRTMVDAIDAAITLKEIGEKRQRKASRREDRRERKADRRK